MKRLWWLNLVRGVVTLIIGILISAWPDSSATTLVNFMGIYWLGSGLMSLRWGFATRKAKGPWFAAGLIGMIGGVAILLRPFYTSYFPPGLPLTLFGIIALVTGLVHIIGGFRTETLSRVHTWGSVLLGVLQIIAGCWAFVGGILLILQSFLIRRAIMVNIEHTEESVQ